MSETAKCNICGEPMPPGETMFKFHGYSGPCPNPPLNENMGFKWPDGYCLDPNGKMSIPAGKEDDFNFGYEIGFQEAWKIVNDALKAANSFLG